MLYLEPRMNGMKRKKSWPLVGNMLNKIIHGFREISNFSSCFQLDISLVCCACEISSWILKEKLHISTCPWIILYKTDQILLHLSSARWNEKKFFFFFQGTCIDSNKEVHLVLRDVLCNQTQEHQLLVFLLQWCMHFVAYTGL